MRRRVARSFLFKICSLLGVIACTLPTANALQLTVAWDSVAGASGYKVERSSNNLLFTEIASVTSQTTSYTDSNLASASYWYRVRAFNDTTKSEYSNVASYVSTDVAPAITQQPASQSATVGGSVTFNVTATGSPAPTYQWQKDGVALSGATSAKLSLPSVTSADAASYTVVVTNAAGSVTSNAATLTVTQPAPTTTAPTIATQPVTQNVDAGSDVTFSVVASGSPAPTYQWRKDGVAISGATTSSLLLSSVSSASAGTYTVVVTNTAGSVTSSGAVLSVTTPIVSVPVTNSSSSNTSTDSGTSTGGNSSSSTSGTTNTSTSNTTTSGSTPATGSNDSTVSNSASNSSSPSTTTSSSSTTTTSSSNSNAGSGSSSSSTSLTSTPSTTTTSGSSTSGSSNTQTGTSTDTASTTAGTSTPSNTETATSAKSTSTSSSSTKESNASTPSSAPVSTPGSRLANASIRATGGLGDQVLIVGFVIDQAKSVLLRAVGPGLAPYTTATTFADPKLTVFDGSTPIATNDNWGGTAALKSAFKKTGAQTLDDTSKDAALVTTLGAKPYTMLVNGSGAGMTLAEVYDMDASGNGHIVNIAARAPVSGGDGVLIAGFVITGDAPKQVLVRGIGPSLASLGVSGVQTRPQIDLFRGTTRIDHNEGWGGDSALKAAFAKTGAFDLTDPNSKDAALLVTLEPGTYSVVVSSANSTTGIALVEVYDVP